MRDTLALEYLFLAVRARFIAEGTPAENLFGWRVSAQQVVGDRIAWKPGDQTGKAGRSAPARNPGRNPRPIGTLLELFTVEISASDPTAPEDELAQYVAARLLRDAWERAVYLAAHGTYAIESQDWIDSAKERRFGAAMRIVCTIQAVVPDAPLLGAPLDVGAVLTLAELDQTDTETIPAAIAAP